MVRSILMMFAALGLAFPLAAGAASKAEKAQVFQENAETFTVEGTVREADDDELKLTRQNLPPMEMEVLAEQSRIMIDGEQASAKDLQPGMEVRAKFQIAGDDIIAVEVEAAREGSLGADLPDVPLP